MRCEEKHQHSTRKLALHAAALAKKHRGVELFVYKCKECRSWHLTKIAPFKPSAPVAA